MTKSLEIRPADVMHEGRIEFSDIPVNAFPTGTAEALAGHSAERLIGIWRDMWAIREFENILNEIKVKGVYRDLAYNHAGPAHLSMGQEPDRGERLGQDLAVAAVRAEEV